MKSIHYILLFSMGISQCLVNCTNNVIPTKKTDLIFSMTDQLETFFQSPEGAKILEAAEKKNIDGDKQKDTIFVDTVPRLAPLLGVEEYSNNKPIGLPPLQLEGPLSADQYLAAFSVDPSIADPILMSFDTVGASLELNNVLSHFLGFSSNGANKDNFLSSIKSQFSDKKGLSHLEKFIAKWNENIKVFQQTINKPNKNKQKNSHLKKLLEDSLESNSDSGGYPSIYEGHLAFDGPRFGLVTPEGLNMQFNLFVPAQYKKGGKDQTTKKALNNQRLWPLTLILPPLGGIGPESIIFAEKLAQKGRVVAIIPPTEFAALNLRPLTDIDYYFKGQTQFSAQFLNWLINRSGAVEQIPPIDENNISALGVSMGGIRLSHWINVEKRIKRAVLIVGGANVPYILSYGQESNINRFRTWHIKQEDLREKGLISMNVGNLPEDKISISTRIPSNTNFTTKGRYFKRLNEIIKLDALGGIDNANKWGTKVMSFIGEKDTLVPHETQEHLANSYGYFDNTNNFVPTATIIKVPSGHFTFFSHLKEYKVVWLATEFLNGK